MKYESKYQTVEAVQMDFGKGAIMEKFTNAEIPKVEGSDKPYFELINPACVSTYYLIIPATKEYGVTQRANMGDYVIKLPDNSLRVVNSRTFQLLYKKGK